jgi:hypothetical protein
MLPEVAQGLQAIAARQGWTRSRVVSWIVCDWFGLDPDTGVPTGKKRKRS